MVYYTKICFTKKKKKNEVKCLSIKEMKVWFFGHFIGLVMPVCFQLLFACGIKSRHRLCNVLSFISLVHHFALTILLLSNMVVSAIFKCVVFIHVMLFFLTKKSSVLLFIISSTCF